MEVVMTPRLGGQREGCEGKEGGVWRRSEAEDITLSHTHTDSFTQNSHTYKYT